MDRYTFKLNDYIVYKKHIGKGSFSTIYKCYHKLTKLEYALKEIIIEKDKNKKNIKRELNLMKKLNHPNIIKLHDVIIDSSLNYIYFIMEYHKKGDLSKFLNGRALKEKYCKKYLRQLSNGLEYLLINNILHRDLKPQNILLTDDFNIQITDFGLARKFNKDFIFNTLCGSPMYMAPEIINRLDYNNKSDLWSVGIIMYEMLHGYTPFKVTNFFDLIRYINKNQITINITISEECENLLLGLLQQNVNKRIEWVSFFNHKWFIENELLKEENNLLDISLNSYSNFKNLPNINNFNLNENQFCSFIHTSIIEHRNNDDNHDNHNNHNNHNNLNLLINNDYSDSDSSDYLSVDETTDEADIDSLSDNGNNGNNGNNSDDGYNGYNGYNSDSGDSEIYDINEINDIYNTNENRINKSRNIPIRPKTKNNNNSFEYEIVSSNYSKLGNSILKKKEFVIINPKYVNSISLPVEDNRTKPLTESLKEYLNSSIKIIKSSYNYINNINNNSI